MSFKNISFILNKPQLSENIGACARALKNFNFSKLVVIDPKPTFPNDKIFATSVGAKDLIHKAKLFNKFEDGLSNFDYLIATSSRFRNKNIKHINLDELSKINYNKKVGFIFGSEASGLSNHEISYVNCTMNIPTNKKFKSLNLSHSVTIICYEIFKYQNKSIFLKKGKQRSISSKKKLSSLVNHLIRLLEDKEFFLPKEKKRSMIVNINNLIYRLQPDDKEIRVLASIMSALYKKN